MKTRAIISLLVIILIFYFSPKVRSQPTTILAIGHTGESFSVGAEITNLAGLGLGGGYVHNGEYERDEIHDYAVPHNNYTILGEKNVDSDVGLYGTFSLNFGANQVIISPGLGVFIRQVWKVARSNATGWLYKQSGRTEWKFDYSLSVHFKPNPNYTLGIGYSKMRGINASLGLTY